MNPTAIQEGMAESPSSTRLSMTFARPNVVTTINMLTVTTDILRVFELAMGELYRLIRQRGGEFAPAGQGAASARMRARITGGKLHFRP